MSKTFQEALNQSVYGMAIAENERGMYLVVDQNPDNDQFAFTVTMGPYGNSPNKMWKFHNSHSIDQVVREEWEAQ